jgi:hypothetical protein
VTRIGIGIAKGDDGIISAAHSRGSPAQDRVLLRSGK